MGAQQSRQQVAQESLYEILGVEKNSTETELKKAYRKAALRLHPDRNFNREEEATKEFTKIQAAYDVLSDPQERAWYDSHGTTGDGPHEQEYGGNITTTDELKKYMEEEIKTSDEFFNKIGQLFGQLKREEAEAALDNGEQEPLLPEFGAKDASFDRHVKPFYDSWSSFNTIKSFAWEDIYRAWDAPDRRTRRAAEQRNKKIREAAKREFNTTVRKLVNTIRTRDPRVKQNNKKKQTKPGNNSAREQRKRDQEANAAKRTEHVEQDWEKVDENDAEMVGDDEEDGDLTVFECVVCDKEFKTKKQLASHESSKKHAKAVALLKREMRKEGVELGFDTAPLSSDDEAPKKQEPEKVEQFPKAPEPIDEVVEQEQEQEQEQEKEQEREQKEETKGRKRRGNQPKIIIESDDSEEEEDDTPIQQREPISEDATLDDLLAQLESTRLKDEPDVQVKGKAKQRRAKKAKQVNEFALKCSVCNTDFTSRNKLFDHVKASGHAAPIGATNGKKSKRK